MPTPNYVPHMAGMEEIRRSWGWFLFIGLAFIILGMACIIFNVTAAFTTVTVFGWLLLIGGVIQLIDALWTGTWSGLSLHLLNGLLRGITGYLLVRYSSLGTEGLTLVLGSYFLLGGLFRAIDSGMAKMLRWGWTAFSGFVSMVLGMIVLGQVPIAGLRTIGFAVGLDLIFDGIAVCSFASAVHDLPQGTVSQAA